MDILPGVVEKTLTELHIPTRLRGYRYLTYSIAQVATDPARIHGVTKDLYRETARRYGTTWQAVVDDLILNTLGGLPSMCVGIVAAG